MSGIFYDLDAIMNAKYISEDGMTPKRFGDCDRDRADMEQKRKAMEQFAVLATKFKAEAKQGAREGVIEYNRRFILGGEPTTRKRGGGRKAQFDTDNLQCAALLALGKEYRDGKANRPASFSAYADIVIRRAFPASDNPFSYRDISDGRECGKVRTMLLKRFDTYLKHLSPPMTRDEALPLACATE